MRIIIIQSEIETAIRNYIQSQITINDDQQIDIDLKATRGDDGYQAVIDILPKKQARATAAKAATPKPAEPVVEPKSDVVEQAAPAKPTVVKATTKASKTKAQPVVEAPVDQEPDMSAEADPASQPSATEDQGVDQPLEEGDTTVADIAADTPASEGAAPRTSLFAGLAAPNNA